ncbi:hypothetical protein Avbf_06880 [Armadillidium vulgare]|nr:hypothetical protein Avbf_06880 [Armadillidium vulgare]
MKIYLLFMRWRYFEAFSTSFVLQVFVSAVICTLYKTICYDFIWNPILLMDLLSFHGHLEFYFNCCAMSYLAAYIYSLIQCHGGFQKRG